MASLRNTFLAASAANIAAMIAGQIMGWMSPTQPKLETPGNFVVIDKEQGSWIGSLVALGAAIGPFPAGYLADRLGRKWTLLSITILFLLGWVLVGIAEPIGSLEVIYAGRVIFGLTVGATFTVLPMYVGEIAEDSIRGALGSFLQLFITIGFLFEYCIGPYVSYVVLIIASAVVPVVFAVGMFFMPDSPYYLLSKGRVEDARSALQWLRSKDSKEVQEEMDFMQECVEEARRNKGSLKDLFASKGNTKALILTLGLVAGQQLSGINVVLFYCESIFKETGSGLSGSVSTIIVGVVMFLSSCCTPLLIERLGRRVLWLISSAGTTIGQFLLGLYFFMKAERESSVEDIGFLPIVAIIFYIMVYSIGFGPLPWAVLGELFPSNVKGIASSLTASFCWLVGFILTKFFTNLDEAIGTGPTFWIFTVCCGLSGVFVFFLLPETKGKSLQEIQDVLNGTK